MPPKKSGRRASMDELFAKLAAGLAARLGAKPNEDSSVDNEDLSHDRVLSPYPEYCTMSPDAKNRFLAIAAIYNVRVEVVVFLPDPSGDENTPTLV